MEDLQQTLDFGFEKDNKQQGPVTVLGRTFANDEERRRVFREELRAKLPELRKIDGFPIGEDDEIINLSDPPYYTACPNPWLNDFIAEWEKEKEQLEKEGKRKADFEVKEPYASDVSEGKNNPIYMAHAYHTKVPHPAIMRYILHYTQPGDTVFDGFCGTGMTGVAANLCGSESDVKALGEKDVKVGVRHGICSDLSPIASLIAASYNLNYIPQEFEKKANAILSQVENELGWMFETEVNGRKAKINYVIWSDVLTCPGCGKEIVLWDESVSKDTKLMFESFPCPNCGMLCTKKEMEKTFISQYDSILETTTRTNKTIPVRINYTLGRREEKNIEVFDKKVLEKVENISLAGIKSFPVLIGDESKRIERNGISHVHQFYTKRSFIILHRLSELCSESPILRAWLSSVLLVTTRMYAFRTDRKGGFMKGTLYIPSFNIEINPLHALKGKISGFISAYYQKRGNSVISISSATDLSTIKADSIDYMFVDPPFGANIMYSELNSIWEGWIGISTNNKSEAIVNKSQNKDLFAYQQLMNGSLCEFYRILKPGKWLTMEFSNTSASVWNSIQNALQGVGFVVANVAALDKKQGSFKAVTTTTAVKQDLIITCFKPTEKLTDIFERSGDTSENVWDFITELMEHLPIHVERDNKTTAVVERSPKILYDRLIAYYVQHGYPIPLDAQEFQRGLREQFVERDGMFFNVEQAVEYDQKKHQTIGIEEYSMFVDSEQSGITWLKKELKDKPQTYQDIQPNWMQAMATPRKGDRVPELMDILKENFLEDESGYWRLPDPEKEADLENMRTKRLLREFDHYVEHANLTKGKRLKDVRLEALRAGFKDCYQKKEFATIIKVGDKIEESLLTEDEILLQYYDIAASRA